jgi:hypothetical protein
MDAYTIIRNTCFGSHVPHDHGLFSEVDYQTQKSGVALGRTQPVVAGRNRPKAVGGNGNKRPKQGGYTNATALATGVKNTLLVTCGESMYGSLAMPVWLANLKRNT